MTCLERALDLYRVTADRHNQAVVLMHLGDTQHAVGRPEAARLAWRDALTILNELHHPDAANISARLDRLDETPRPFEPTFDQHEEHLGVASITALAPTETPTNEW